MPFLFSLLLDIGQKPHEAGAFDCGFHGSLLLGGEASALAALDAAVRIDELAQEINVFVIDVSDVILCENVGHNYI